MTPPDHGRGRRRSPAASVHSLVLVLTLSLAAGVGACARVGHSAHSPIPEPAVDWPAALGDAQRAADAGRYADADRLLIGFAEHYADSPEAAETLFWRALFLMDPVNQDRSSKDAVAALDAYLAHAGMLPHRVEATVARRVLGALDSVSAELQAAKAAPPPPSPATLAAERAKDEELTRLRDSLTRTSAELDRVRRRLAPRP
ncbi:MAG: hypothetical protein ACJ79S_14380 [Gemmatimonadaceae bacterium]